VLRLPLVTIMPFDPAVAQARRFLPKSRVPEASSSDRRPIELKEPPINPFAPPQAVSGIGLGAVRAHRQSVIFFPNPQQLPAHRFSGRLSGRNGERDAPVLGTGAPSVAQNSDDPCSYKTFSSKAV